MEPALIVGEAFFPLDEELGLLSGGLTPRAEEMLVRLSTWMPYESARELLEDLLGIQVSKASARRATLHTGEAALLVWEAQVERLKQEAPQAPAGADKQAMSGDGAMVHLVGGEWAEVKTLAIGQVTRNSQGEVCTQQLSYCSRLGDATSFAQATLLETHRRLGRPQLRATARGRPLSQLPGLHPGRPPLPRRALSRPGRSRPSGGRPGARSTAAPWAAWRSRTRLPALPRT